MPKKDKKDTEEVPIPVEEDSEKEIEAQKILTGFHNHFSFGYPTRKNIDALRTLTHVCLPIHYRDWFYNQIFDRDIKLCRCGLSILSYSASIKLFQFISMTY